MNFVDELNCTTVLEAIKKEKERIKNELDNKSKIQMLNLKIIYLDC